MVGEDGLDCVKDFVIGGDSHIGACCFGDVGDAAVELDPGARRRGRGYSEVLRLNDIVGKIVILAALELGHYGGGVLLIVEDRMPWSVRGGWSIVADWLMVGRGWSWSGCGWNRSWDCGSGGGRCHSLHGCEELTEQGFLFGWSCWHGERGGKGCRSISSGGGGGRGSCSSGVGGVSSVVGVVKLRHSLLGEWAGGVDGGGRDAGGIGGGGIAMSSGSSSHSRRDVGAVAGVGVGDLLWHGGGSVDRMADAMVVVGNDGVCGVRNGGGEELRVQGESRGEPWAPLAAVNSSNSCVEAEGPDRMALVVVTGLCGVA